MIKAGVELVRKALEAPIRQITKNAGVDGSVVVGKLLEQKKNAWLWCSSRRILWYVCKRYYRPVKVVRTALQDAASI